MRDDNHRRRASKRNGGADADYASPGELRGIASHPARYDVRIGSRRARAGVAISNVVGVRAARQRHPRDLPCPWPRQRWARPPSFFLLLLTIRRTSSLNADPVGAPPSQRRRSAPSELLWGNRGRKHVKQERVLCRLRDHVVMRGTVLGYDHGSESYGIRGDLDGVFRDVHAMDVAPIHPPDQGIQSDTPDFGMFTAPAPLNPGGHRGRDAAAAILGAMASPHPRGAQGDGQSPAQLVRETPPAMASRPKSPARRTSDTEVVEVSDDSGDDGDGENGDLRRGDVFDEDGDDFDEGIIGTESEGESDEEPNGDAPVVDPTGDSDDSLSDSDGDVQVAGGGPNDDMDAFSSGLEVEIVDEVHVVPDEHENPPPGQHGGGGRGGGRGGAAQGDAQQRQGPPPPRPPPGFADTLQVAEEGWLQTEARSQDINGDEGVKPGDWICPAPCHHRNWNRFMMCKRCWNLGERPEGVFDPRGDTRLNARVIDVWYRQLTRSRCLFIYTNRDP
ncbi:predicted protein [Micromonas commoda]|uniref:RanBP2-type domain-containing protein n=1 Tax=Micromonas commoda (strain RCC299 / NOUM17 / CCMP2709) TaxID=296587 RepID=C1EJL9_MICCC|nr:predicted protein [Micromonas commoda]ACO68209.1 predicted protein [Micromonas commoda]|eukprot:XP_002506951.1 predicted protein [Micromonas commoda]